jgi:hypothetical protein
VGYNGGGGGGAYGAGSAGYYTQYSGLGGDAIDPLAGGDAAGATAGSVYPAAGGFGGGGGGSYANSTGSLAGSNFIFSAGAVPAGNGLVLLSKASIPVGTVQNAILFTSGGLIVDEGSTASGLVVTSGTTLTISAGETASGTTILAGGTLAFTGTSGSLAGLTLAGVGLEQINLATGSTLDVTGAAGLSLANGSTLNVSNGTLVIDGSISLTGSLTETNAAIYDDGVLVNNGTITLDPSTLTVASLSGTGDVTIDTSSTLDVTGDISAGETIVFSGSLGVLGITDTANIAGTIDITGTGAIIDITDLAYSALTSGTFNTLSDQLMITYGSGSILDLTFANAAITSFVLASYGQGGTDIEMPCFCSGTRLLTEDGEVLVEDIAVGDVLVTVREDGPLTQKVIWTGRRAIDIRWHPAPDLVRPIRITAGAIAPGVPERDLRLSPEHAVYLNGNLFTAVSLVNGTTIYQEQSTTHVTYHHIELETHDILMVEGLPCESFLDTGSKNMFENVSGITILHPDFRPGAGAEFCAPLIRDGAELDQVRAALNARIRKQA